MTTVYDRGFCLVYQIHEINLNNYYGELDYLMSE